MTMVAAALHDVGKIPAPSPAQRISARSIKNLSAARGHSQLRRPATPSQERKTTATRIGTRNQSHRMGLLDQLWDETVAGPPPDHGLGRLRKYSSSSATAAANAASAVTRSITIARPPSLSLPSGESSSVPLSPATAPDSPFAAATSRRDGWRAFRRNSKIANVDVVRAEAAIGPRSPTVYDWVVISSLDR